ncbi:aldose reductase A-like [Corticium candelabrum]|uniref:aldose reductase A-like n=1 Tax=Corticium candelabrum TaxID=121492 RepID=UPI002E2584B3|nr:aldose reductase A-like [Corticium candelabrum]
MSAIPTLQLSSGTLMPVLGYGTWLSEAAEVAKGVKWAIETGYRHIDCAERYGNQREIGHALSELWKSGYKREDVFITSKLWNTRHDCPEESVRQTLKNLQLEYLDLYLIHFPEAFPRGAREEEMGSGKRDYAAVTLTETWQKMESLVDKGLVKAIGVSNFLVSEIQEILGSCRIKPAVNQIEVHPYNTSIPLVEFCHTNGIAVTAYSPLANQYFLTEVDPNNTRRPNTKDMTPLLQHPVVTKISEAHKKTAAQVLIRYVIDRGMTVIPKSMRLERIKENYDVFDFKLTEADVGELNAMNVNFKLVDPGWRLWPQQA